MQHFYGDAEKFIQDIYWSESHDKDNRLNIPERLAERLIKDDKEHDPEYYNHRQGVIHASSLGKCLRGVVHEMLGTEKDNKEPDARKLGIFKAGHLFEDFIVDSLSDLMLDRQTEYVYAVGDGVILTGRDDGTFEFEGQRRMLECKSVHSDSFWHREREGTLVAYQNQMQIQTYLWLRRILPNVFIRKDTGEIIYTNFNKQQLWEYRGMKPDDVLTPVEKPDNSNLNGSFAYISKDDCTTIQAPVKFNNRIIEEVVKPALDAVKAAYLAKSVDALPVPPLAVYDKGRGQWKQNWLCKYCDYHTKCAGAGWVMEAQAEVTRLNKEQSMKMVNNFQAKPEPPKIEVAPKKEEVPENVVLSPFPSPNTPIEVSDAPAPTPPQVSPPVEGETTLERMMRENKEKNTGL